MFIDEQVMKLAGPSVQDCNAYMIDGTAIVIEINRDGTYQNYEFPESVASCDPSRVATRFVWNIGLEFDDGTSKCAHAEWFPCATYRKEHGIEDFPK